MTDETIESDLRDACATGDAGYCIKPHAAYELMERAYREISRLTAEFAKKDAALREADGALKIGREHCLTTNRSEGMLDGFGNRKPRQSDADLSAIDDAIATIRAALGEIEKGMNNG